MCGRFTLRTPAAQWCQLFLPQLDPADLDPSLIEPPRYNIAPTQSIPCVLCESTTENRIAQMLRWGLVPSWADDLRIGSRMINARSETADTKPSFRRAFVQRRCLIPADGYYEWEKTQDGKQPYLIERADSGVMAMAGLWEENRKLAPADSVMRTCTILTTDANATTRRVHDRMPVFLDPEHFENWLDPNFRNIDELKSLLKPASESWLRLKSVSTHVNNARNDDPECVV